MTLPLYMKDFFGYYSGLAIATAIGLAFGFVLERSGFGRASILAAQFYFTNMRVLKVMFTSIVTTLLGMTILAGAGVLDMSALSIPATFLWPQLAGGLLLGMGFIVSGYCPGTGLACAAAGRLDGLIAIIGMLTGALVFILIHPSVAARCEDVVRRGSRLVLRPGLATQPR